MLNLAPCPHCASRVPDDGAFCDSCGRALAACPTCHELVRPGERCIVHGVAAVARTPAKPRTASTAGDAGAPSAPAAAVTAPTVAPPPRRVTKPAPASAPATANAATNPATNPVAKQGASAAPSAQPTTTPVHAAQGTTVQALARSLRLVAVGGIALPSLEVAPDTVIGRGEGPFAMLLDPFHDKGLSRRHCQFRRAPTGSWSVVDLAGRNSTFVSPDGNWSSPPLAQHASHPVEPGRDQLRLGLLTFRIEGVA